MNDWNKIIQGLLTGGAALGQGFINKSYINQADEEFNTFKKSLMDVYANSLNTNKQIIDYGTQKLFNNVSSDNTLSQNIQNLQSQTIQDNTGTIDSYTKPEVDPMARYNSLINFQQKMLNNPYGEKYSQLAENVYNSLIPKPPKKDIREVNGQLIDITSGVPQVLYGEKKEEKKKFTVGDYSKMTAEDVMKLGENEFWDAFKFVNEDVRNELLKNPFVKQEYDQTFKEGDFAPKLPSGKKTKGIGSILPKTSFREENDISQFKNVAQTMEKINSNIRLGDEEKSTFDKNMTMLTGQYGLSPKDVQKIADQIYNANDTKEATKIFNELRKGDYSNDNSNISDQMINKRRDAYTQYIKDLDYAYQLEQSGQQAQGYFQKAKEQFYNELEWDKDNGIVTLKEYKYYHDLYK